MNDSKKVTQKFLGLKSVIDPWTEEKAKILHFYRTCFKDKKWQNPDLSHLVPEVIQNLKRLDYAFPKMNPVIDVAFDAYADFFGKDKAWKAWKKISEAMDYASIQPRPKDDYFYLHVGGIEPDMLNKSYDDGVNEGIIFMTPLEGIISAFRHRFETGKMYDVIGVTRLSSLDCDGKVMNMCKDSDGRFSVDSFNRDYDLSNSGFRQACFKTF